MTENKPKFLSSHLAFIGGDLFSQFFVTELISKKATLSPLTNVEIEESERAFNKIKKVFESYGITSNSKFGERKVEDILREIFFCLGFYAEKPKSGSDLVLFKQEDKKFACKWDGKAEEGFRRCICILEAKKTNVSGGLDGRYEKETFAEQLVRYLNVHKVDWGILTNAISWRIYYLGHRDSPTKYYEVNLVDLISHGDLETFNYFYFFFRSMAFDEHNGIVPLKNVWLQKANYLADVRDNLQKRFVESIEFMAQGIDHKNQIEKFDYESLFAHCFRVAYRAIFLKVLEDRRLFPVLANEYNTSAGIRMIDNFIQKNKGDLSDVSKDEYKLYDCLMQSFREFKDGKYGIKGDLFSDPDDSAMVKKHKIPDYYMANSLYKLFYLEDNERERRVKFDCFSDRDLGTLYESLFRHSIVKKGSSIILEYDSKKAKLFGSFYTEEYICDHMVKSSLNRLSINKTLPEEILNLQICDPAMGSGHFLLSALKILAEHLSHTGYIPCNLNEQVPVDIDYMREILSNCIYGIDVNKMAVDLAKLSLWLATAKKGTPFVDIEEKLIYGDSLISDTNVSIAAINLKVNNLFNMDLVIGNPPFIETKLLRDEQKLYLYDNYDSMFEKSNYYVCFFERSIGHLLKKGGILSLISPPDWLDFQKSYKPFKDYLISNSVLLEVCKLDDNAFPVPTNYYIFRNVSIDGDVQVEQGQLNYLSKKNNVEYVNTGRSSASKIMNLEVDSTLPTVVIKGAVQSLTISDNFDVVTGLSVSDIKVNNSMNGTGNFLKKGVKDLVSISNEDFISGFNYDYCVTLASSADRMRTKEAFESEKIILKRRPLTIIYDDKKCYCKSNCFIIRNKIGSSFNLKYVALILNSSPFRLMIEEYVSKAQVGKNLLSELKIPYVECDIEDFYKDIVDLPIELQVSEIDDFFFGISQPIPA